jgi:hypothetical protein
MRSNWKRYPYLGVFVAAVVACDQAVPTTPIETGNPDEDVAALAADYSVTATAAAFDASGIGGADFPEALALTTEQKADVVDRQRRFERDNTADLARLRILQNDLRRARDERRPDGERRRIVGDGRRIRSRLDSAFTRVGESVASEVYTEPQRQWVRDRDPRNCRNGDRPHLTPEQVEEIRALQAAFEAESAEIIRQIQAIVAEARAAAAAGASREEVQAILERADHLRRELAALEQRLRQAIADILNQDQRRHPCVTPGGVVVTRG